MTLLFASPTDAARILPLEAGEGDRANHGGGGCRASRLGGLAAHESKNQDSGGGSPHHHRSDDPPPPLRGGGCAPPDCGLTLGDPRFRALLGADAWAILPAQVRRRFAKRLAGGDSVTYRGQVLDTRMSRAGRLLSQLARLVGGPLPLAFDTGVAAAVTVTEDAATRGQHWTRLYVRHGRFPQVIHSSKRFAGPTGLEEYVGRGLGMALTVHAEPDALVFRSAFYFVDFGFARLTLPLWLAPGAITVTHRELGGGRFRFELALVHPRLGELIHQTAEFEEKDP